MLTATQIAERLNIDPTKGVVNRALRSLGFIRKNNNRITVKGKKAGGGERQTTKNGDIITFCLWQETILRDQAFLQAIEEASRPTRDRTYRSESGHEVRSLGELLIANWLYYRELTFEYNPQIYGSQYYADFYLFPQDIYIEYWGSNKPGYVRRKTEKQAFYLNNGYKLIDVTQVNFIDLSAFFERNLRSFGYNVTG